MTIVRGFPEEGFGMSHIVCPDSVLRTVDPFGIRCSTIASSETSVTNASDEIPLSGTIWCFSPEPASALCTSKVNEFVIASDSADLLAKRFSGIIDQTMYPMLF